MAGRNRTKQRYDSLRNSGDVLRRMAPWVRFGVFSAGLSLFMDQIRPMLSDAQFTWGERRVMGIVALFTLGGFGLGGWVAGRLLRASSELIDLLIDGADAAWRTADLIELQMVPALGRIALALERSTPRSDDADLAKAVDAVRRTIAGGRWEQAERLVSSLARDFPGSPDASALREDLDEARGEVVARLRERLDRARDGNDPMQAIEVRDELTMHLRGQVLSDLDRQLVRWLIAWIRQRTGSKIAGEELSTLVARMVESFGEAPEGIDLAGLLTRLRKDAGLCPRCGRPYRGPDAACPVCLTDPRATRPSSSTRGPTPKDLP